MNVSVVTNAGPLIVLTKLNLLHLLKQLYHHVSFPDAVYQETVEEGLRRGYEDARLLRLFLSSFSLFNSSKRNDRYVLSVFAAVSRCVSRRFAPVLMPISERSSRTFSSSSIYITPAIWS